MRRLLDMIRSGRVSDDPVSILFHYIRGHMVNWVDGNNGPVHWVGGSHRGLQFLDKVEFPRKQKRYIFSPLFEIRYDTAFEEVIRACADRSRDLEHKTWISEEYVRGMTALHRLGFAHSYEAWNEGKLVGGAFGVQLGSMISCDSMFHRMSNASKAAYGQTLVHLQKRGFKVVDTNGVADHQVNYGEEWVPQWRYERLILECLREAPSLTDDRPYPKLPREVRALIPALRPVRVFLNRMPWRRPVKATGPGAENATSTDAEKPSADEGAKPQAAAGAASAPASTVADGQ